jgi:hypothetical protein
VAWLAQPDHGLLNSQARTQSDDLLFSLSGDLALQDLVSEGRLSERAIVVAMAAISRIADNPLFLSTNGSSFQDQSFTPASLYD